MEKNLNRLRCFKNRKGGTRMNEHQKRVKIELFNDHFENAKRYQIPRAQLIIADIPLIEIYTDEGDVVIDPVVGSCSTLRACAELKRSCYGFEIKKNFYNQAKEKMLSNVETQLF